MFHIFVGYSNNLAFVHVGFGSLDSDALSCSCVSCGASVTSLPIPNTPHTVLNTLPPPPDLGKMKVSLRNLNILLALVCILITSVVCMVMSITSADAALSDTNTLVENTADECFGTGDASLRRALEDYLTSVQEGASQIIVNFLDTHRLLTEKIVAEMGAYPPDVSESWDFLRDKRSALVNEFRIFNKIGMTGVGVIGRKGQACLIYEDSRTISNPVEGYHHYFMGNNNGSDHDAEAGAPTEERTIIGTVDPFTGEFVAPENSTRRSMTGEQPGCEHDSIAFDTNGAQPVPRCNIWGYDQRQGIYGLSAFSGVRGEAGVRWSHLFQVPPYVVLFMFGTWSHETANGVQLGFVFNGLDVRAITRQLGQIKLGNGGPTSKGRLYTCANKNWMYDATGIPSFDQEHFVTGVSHGEYVFLVHECTRGIFIFHVFFIWFALQGEVFGAGQHFIALSTFLLFTLNLITYLDTDVSLPHTLTASHHSTELPCTHR